MKREMVTVTLWEDYTYEVKDVNPAYATSKFAGWKNGMPCIGYYCLKTRWKNYLLKLIDPKKIDKEIEELQRKKRRVEKLKKKILKEIADESKDVF